MAGSPERPQGNGEPEPARPEKSERPVITVRPGEPFRIPSDQVRFNPHELTPVTIGLNVLGVGLGRLDMLRAHPDEAIEPLIGPVRTPAGPIEMKFRFYNGSAVGLPETVPGSLRIRFDNLSRDAAHRLDCWTMRYDNQGFTTLLEADHFTGEWAVDGEDTFDQATGEDLVVLFPQRSEIFNHLEFQIDVKPE